MSSSRSISARACSPRSNPIGNTSCYIRETGMSCQDAFSDIYSHHSQVLGIIKPRLGTWSFSLHVPSFFENLCGFTKFFFLVPSIFAPRKNRKIFLRKIEAEGSAANLSGQNQQSVQKRVYANGKLLFILNTIGVFQIIFGILHKKALKKVRPSLSFAELAYFLLT